MITNPIISAVVEGLEDEDFKDVAMTGALKDEDIKYWSHYLRSWRFNTEEEARQKMFDMLQHHDKSPGPFEPWGESRNRWVSQSIPVYQDRFGKFRIGYPLTTWAKAKRQAAYQRRKTADEKARIADKKDFEHLFPGWSYPGFGAWSNSHYRQQRKQNESLQEYCQANSFHSDFSDGTNGEPSAPAPATNGEGEHPGLPDYKYLDRLKKLKQRRDPESTSKVPADTALRRKLGESDDEDFKDITAPGPALTFERCESVWPDAHRVRYQDGEHDYFLGSVWRVPEAPKTGSRRVNALRKIDNEYPWTGQAASYLYDGKARFKNMQEAGNWLYHVRFKIKPDMPLTDYDARIRQAYGSQQEAMEDDEGGDVTHGDYWITLDRFVETFDAVPVPVIGRNTFHKYVFDAHKDVDMILRVARQESLSPEDHVWTMYRLVSRDRDIFINRGMRYNAGGWGSMERVIGWLLTRHPSSQVLYRLDPGDVQDNAVYTLY